MDSLERGLSPSKDSGDDAEALPDERILAPGLTIVEEEGSLSAADLGGHSGPNENSVMYRVMQVGSSGEVIELPQIVTRNFNTSNNQPSVISSNPLNNGQFYIVGPSPELLVSGSQRSIAPRGSVAANRDLTSTRGGSQVEPPRDDRRRVSHNEVERRRRDKINNWILKLGKIMPDSALGDAGKNSQQSKGGILAKACDYIQDIRTANQRLADALRQSEHHVEELQSENAALRKELEQLHMSSIGKS